MEGDRNHRTTRHSMNHAAASPQLSPNSAFSIPHSAFSIGATAPRIQHSALGSQPPEFSFGATAPRIQHSALAQQAALTPAPQSKKTSFSIPHSAFSIGATAPRVPHSAFSIGATAPRVPHSAFSTGATAPRVPHSAFSIGADAPPPAPQSDHSAFSIQHSALIDAPTICDIHHHIVWGIDSDGPKTMEDSKAMALAAVRDGITHIVTTPHVMPGIAPFDGERFRQRLAALQSWCSDQGMPLWLYPGAEIFYTPMTVQFLNEGRVPTMNGTAHVLVEFDPGERYEQIRKTCAELTAHGYIPILAHTERYTALVRHPKAALALREELSLAFQVNCGTIIAPNGFWQQRFIKSLLKEGALDMVATDAHNITTRPVRMKEAIAKLYTMCDPASVTSIIRAESMLNSEC